MSITFPPEFRPITKYPGYFWNVAEEKLYSIKGGQLRPLKLITWRGRQNMELWDYCKGPYYAVSHKGRRRYLGKNILKATTFPDPYELPVTA